jgi:phosphate transport system protein
LSTHLRRDLDHLKKDLLEICSMVEEATNKAILALEDRRAELAEEVIKGDEQIDTKEVALEEDCLKILALYQPVAADLRFIITALKVSGDLERMGDLAVNIAERALYLSANKPIAAPLDFGHMVEGVRTMLRASLEALVDLNSKLARTVLTADDEIDRIHRGMYATLQDLMKKDPEAVERATQLLSASRHLERIADLATNIAEDVVFMVEGEMVRHGRDNAEKK